MEEPNPSYMVISGVQYVTTDEAAKRLGNDVTPDMIRDWTKRGLLKPVGRYGGRANIYRLADVAHAEMRTRTQRRGRTRRAGELQKNAEWGQNLPAEGQADSAQRPVKIPRCSVIRENASECNRFAVPGMPFRICRDHARETFLHWKDHHPDDLPEMPELPAPRVEVFIPERNLVPRVEARQPFVYYIRFRDRIKIGCTLNPTSRLAVLPHDEVLAIEPGSYDLERMRHQQFAAQRITTRGEWFRVHPDLLAHVDMLLKHFGAAEEYLGSFGIRLVRRSPMKDSA